MKTLPQLINKAIILILFIVSGTSISAYGQEELKIAWPGEYKWKIGSDQKSADTRLVELIPGNETLSNWTIIGTMISLMRKPNITPEQMMNATFNQMLKRAPNSKLRLIEKSDNAGAPFVLFKIESPRFTDKPAPESQLYYIIKGKQALYTNFVAMKQPSLGVLFVEKWVKVFKGSMLVE